MSGEAMMIGTGARNGGILLLAGSAAWAVVQGVIDQRREEARARLKARKDRLAAWNQFQQNQQRQVQELAQGRAELAQRLQALQTHEPQALSDRLEVRSQGFVASEAEQAALRTRLDRLDEWLAAVPAALAQGADSPFPHLAQESARLRAAFEAHRPLAEATLASLQATVEQTLQAQLQDAERRRQTQERLLAEAEGLLDAVLGYRDLSPEPQLEAELEAAQHHLARLLQAPHLRLADLDLLRRKFQQLKAAIDAALQQAATREALEQTLQRNLEQLGYRRLEAKAGGEGLWAVPGGEQLRVAVQRNLGLAFQLQHERFEHGDFPLSAGELAHLRRQERRWCDDLKTLNKRLIAEGFQYQLQFEREIPEASIPIVVVEEVDEILAEEERREAEGPKKRSL